MTRTRHRLDTRVARRLTRLAGAIGGLVLAAGLAFGEQTPSSVIQIPANAKVLEGVPEVSVETTREGATRRRLDAAEAAQHRLTINVTDGRLYWAGQGDQPLTVSAAGDFTYLLSARPGRYVRLTRVNDRLTYAAHLDMGLNSVTYWGELKIVGK